RGTWRSEHPRDDGQHADDLYAGRQAVHRVHRGYPDRAGGAGRVRAGEVSSIRRAAAFGAVDIAVQHSYRILGRGRSAGERTSREDRVMTFGIPTELFLQIHVAISLIGIASG